MGEVWDEILSELKGDQEGRKLLEWISEGRCVCRFCNLVRSAMARRSLPKRRA